MPATKEQMLEEFKLKYGESEWESKKLGEKKYLNDLAIIGSFLHPENSLFCEALQALDDAMIKVFEERTLTTFNKGTKVQKSFSDFSHGRAVKHTTKIASPTGEITDTKDDATKHLLSIVLARFEKSQGFVDVDEQTGKCVCFYNGLPGDEFGASIKSMHMAKDYVGDEHGAFTHRIQWYLAGIMRKKLALQSTGMNTLFSLSGRTWGLVFDRNAGPKVALLKDDFRRPELMNPWIANNPRYGNYGWPVLSAFLKSRMNRMSRRGWAPDVLKINLAAKMYGKTPSATYRSNSAIQNAKELEGFNLSEVQMTEINKVVGGGIYDPAQNKMISLVTK